MIFFLKMLLLALGIMSTEPKDSTVSDWGKGREQADFGQSDLD